ncbi:MAG: recombinase family protein [Dehalococcoidia bacterium]|nr:recombinase family protein [Dehalococcoidia bacterium]
MAEHITKGKRKQFSLGLPVGSLPLGYARSEEPGSAPILVEDEAKAIRRAFRLRAQGASLSDIAKHFEDAGIRPRSRIGYDRFTVSSVQSLIGNRFYAGFVVRRGEYKRGQHQPLVTEEAWLAAQSTTRLAPRRSAATPALLAGLARCMLCGGPVWTSTTGTRDSRVVSYREAAHLQFRACPAARRMWSCRAADETVATVVTEMALDSAWLEKVDRDARSAPRQADEAELARVEGQRTRANRAYIAGNLPEAEWQKMLADLNRRAAELRREPINVSFLGERLQSMGQLWSVATIEQKRRALRHLFKAVHLDCGAKTLSLEPTPEFAPLFDLRRRGVLDLPPAGIEPAHMV